MSVADICRKRLLQRGFVQVGFEEIAIDLLHAVLLSSGRAVDRKGLALRVG